MSNITRARVTKTLIDKLPLNSMIRDTEIRGFGIRRQAGPPIFFLQKRVNGRLRWITIGPYGAPWTLDAARKKAIELIQSIHDGRDPHAEKVLRRENLTLSEAAQIFIAEHGPKLKPTTYAEYRRLLTVHIVPSLGSFRIDDITAAHVGRFHASLSRIPSSANFSMAVISKLMTWATATGRRAAGPNPCLGIKKYRTNKRERFLTVSELQRVGDAMQRAEIDGTETPFALAAIRLLLLTGARRNEILTLRWSEVDFTRSCLRLPDSKTGQKVIKLSPDALDILKTLPRVVDNPFVVVGDVPGRHLIALQNTWERLRVAAGLPEVRIHDLRHSFASVAIASGASLPMIGKLLGHRNPQTTQRYAHLADDPVFQLNDAISGTIAASIFSTK